MKRVSAFLLSLVMILTLSACGHDHSNEPEFVMADMWDVSCHTEDMTAYLKGDLGNVTKYATGTREISIPKQYVFNWDVKKAKKYKIKSYTFILASGPALSQVIYQCEVDPKDHSVGIDHLYLQQIYYWGVIANLEDGTKYQSEVQEFLTSGAAPRFINVPGVTNCRDLGGWTIENSNNRVKQGMIYRTGRMNDNKKEKVTIKPEGIEVLKNELGIKTEIDLRRDEVRTVSALGEEVNYINIPMSGNDVYRNPDNLKEEVKQVFKILADEKNYPLQIHCSVGTDRTGYICYLINGLLGVAEEDLYRDYLFSNFGKVDGMRKLEDITEGYTVMIKAEEGDRLSEKINNYLLKIGVTASEIESVRSILIERK